MRLILLGGIALVITLTVVVLRFLDFSSKWTEFGNYGGLFFSLLVVFFYFKERFKKAEEKSKVESWDGIGRDKKIPLGFEALFIVGFLAMVWFNTFGFYTEVFSSIGNWNEEVKTFKEEKISYIFPSCSVSSPAKERFDSTITLSLL